MTNDLPHDQLTENLKYLKLPHLAERINDYVCQAEEHQLSKLDFFHEAIQAEAEAKRERANIRRIKAARFPYQRGLDNYQFHHPKQIDSDKVKHLFRLDFLSRNENIIFCGTVGLGKTHLAIALGRQAAVRGANVLFGTAVEIINQLIAAQKQGNLTRKLKAYTKPKLLIIDELGYMPIDKHGCDLLFQIISARYERASTIITTNRVYKDWPIIFNNDATVTSAILDRLLHHSQSILIHGRSYRMKDNPIQPEE